VRVKETKKIKKTKESLKIFFYVWGMAKTTCTCITDIESKILKVKQDQGIKAIKAEIQNVAWFFDGNDKTVSNVKITVWNKKKLLDLTMVHSYCPFCGKPYPVNK
jgi:hypothetical protein